jgi:DNA mismatch repair ATPase MutS
MSKEKEYEAMMEKVEQLQEIIKERRNKHEPFLSSFVDALKHVVSRAKEWFDEEVSLAEKEIALLEELVPVEDFSDDKSKLAEIENKFNNSIRKFDEMINSVKSGKIKRLKDFTKEGMVGVVKPEFIEELLEMYNISVELENLIESLEERARYITYPLNIIRALAKLR